jgi:hypothetical protein
MALRLPSGLFHGNRTHINHHLDAARIEVASLIALSQEIIKSEKKFHLFLAEQRSCAPPPMVDLRDRRKAETY